MVFKSLFLALCTTILVNCENDPSNNFQTTKASYISTLRKPGQYSLPGVMAAVVTKVSTTSIVQNQDTKNFFKNKITQLKFYKKKKMTKITAKEKSIFQSNDSIVLRIMEYVEKKLAKHFPDDYISLKALELPDKGCFLSFPLNEQETFNKSYLFEFANTLSEKHVEKLVNENLRAEFMEKRTKKKEMEKNKNKYRNETNKEKKEDQMEKEEENNDDRENQVLKEEEDEGQVHMSTYSLVQAIQKADKGFGDNALLDWTDLPDQEASNSSDEQEKRNYLIRLLKKVAKVFRKVVKQDPFQEKIKKLMKQKGESKKEVLAEAAETLKQKIDSIKEKEKFKEKEQLLIKIEELQTKITDKKMKKLIKAQENKKEKVKKKDKSTKETKQRQKNLLKEEKKKLKSIEKELKQVKKLKKQYFEFQLELELYETAEKLNLDDYKNIKSYQQLTLDQKQNILNELINKVKQQLKVTKGEIFTIVTEEKKEQIAYLNEKLEAYSLALHEYQTQLEMKLAVYGLNNTNKLIVLNSIKQYINKKIDQMDEDEKLKLVKAMMPEIKKGNFFTKLFDQKINAEREVELVKKEIAKRMKTAVTKEKIRQPNILFNKICQAVHGIEGMDNSLKDKIKEQLDAEFSKNNINSEYSHLQSLEEMEREIENLEKDLDPINFELNQKLEGMDKKTKKWKIIEVLGEMIQELDGKIKQMTKREKERKQAELLHQISGIQRALRQQYNLEEALAVMMEKEKQEEKRITSFQDAKIQEEITNESEIQEEITNESEIQEEITNESEIQEQITNESEIQEQITNESEDQEEITNESKILNKTNQEKSLRQKMEKQVDNLKEQLKQLRLEVKQKVLIEAKHPFDFLQTVKFDVAVKPGGQKFKNLSAKVFQKIINGRMDINESEDTKEMRTLFTEEVKKLGEAGKNCIVLRELVAKAIYDSNSTDYASKVLRARLGAQALSSVLNIKKFSKDLGYAVGISFCLAGGLSYSLYAYAWPALITALGIASHGHAILLVVVNCALGAFTSFAAETIDASVIKQFLNTLQGGNFMPGSWKQSFSILKDALIAGGIAGFFAIPANMVTQFHHGWLFPIAAFANQIASPSSGASMIPLNLLKVEKYLQAGLLLRTQSGFYPTPTKLELEDIKQKIIERNKKNMFKQFGLASAELAEEEQIYLEFVKRRINIVRKIAKITSFGAIALGIGSFLSFVTWLPVFFLAKVELISSVWEKTIAVFPKASKAFSSWWSSDATRHHKMIELIFEKAIMQLDKGPLQEITDEELSQIHITKLSAYRFGKYVIKVSNFFIENFIKILKKTKKVFGVNVSPDLLEGINIAKILGLEPKEEVCPNEEFKLESKIDKQDEGICFNLEKETEKDIWHEEEEQKNQKKFYIAQFFPKLLKNLKLKKMFLNNKSTQNF